jgi:putative methionine-R-sulfoxide reductase with GAF domain
MERTVARLHRVESTFDWVAVYALRGNTLAGDMAPRTEVVVPIIRDRGVLGVLYVDSNTPDAFGEREARAIKQAAERIASKA